MTLQYPLNLTTDSDYVTFSWHKWVANQRRVSGNAAMGPAGGTIRLYTPESTPEVTQTNIWERKDFEGPAGLLSSGLARMVASGGTQGGAQVAGNIAGALGQGILSKIAEQAGMSASQLTALKGGEVYNPNVELLYKTPSLRKFDFMFRFLPSTAVEARAVRDIILTFKKWSSPLNTGDMFEVPYVWKVAYRQPDMMGKFKFAALVNVTMHPLHITQPLVMVCQLSMHLDLVSKRWMLSQEKIKHRELVTNGQSTLFQLLT
jgi:hypothetical protein